MAMAGSGGSGGDAGSGGSGGSSGAAGPDAGTLTRPELTSGDAANYTVLKYLEKAGNVAAPVADGWDPTAGIGDVATFTANFTVAATGGTHTTVQAAIDAAVAAGGTDRVYVAVEAGTYREIVCVPSQAPPITLYGLDADASQTTIVFDNYSGKAKAVDAAANPCNPNTGEATYGTSGSATFAAYAADFQAKNLTISNDTDEATATGALQAVALLTQGDKLVFENVRLLGNQDTFYAKTSNVAVVSRVYVKDSYIEGDVDFIFGRASLVVDGGTIHYLSTRNGSAGYVAVPSTDSRNPYGILINGATFTADSGTAAGQTYLGRAWDESQKDVPTYTTNVATGVYPNGQALIRESTLGAHIRSAAPWAEAATTHRPFSAVATTVPANRLFEYQNTAPVSAQ